MANQLGQALEDVSRATGAVAHFYKTLNIGATGAQATLETCGFEQSFRGIIEEVGSIRNIPATGAPSAQLAAAARPSPPAVDLLNAMRDIVQPQDLMKWMMGQYDQLDHISQGVYKVLNDTKTNNCEGSVDALSKVFAKQICDKLKTEGVKDSIHEGFEPVMNIQDVLEKSLAVGIEKILQGGAGQGFAAFYPAIKEQAIDALGKSVEEIEDGFVNGEADVLKFIEYNINEYNKASAGPPPPGDNGMAERMMKMKGAQQLAMVNKGLAAYKAAKGGGAAA